METSLTCPRCGGTLTVHMRERITLVNSNGTLAFHNTREPNTFTVACGECPMRLTGEWKGIADTFGLQVAER